MPITLKCQQCNKEFRVTPNRKDTAKYCSRRCHAESLRGQSGYWLGKHRSDETREKIRNAHLGKKLSEEHKRKIGLAGKGRLPWNTGKVGVFTEESNRKRSEALKGRFMGPDNPRWKGGMHVSRRRNLELIEIFRTRNSDGVIRCHFCNKEITKLRGLSRDALVIHSLDKNHENWDASNKVPAHLACHTSFHTRDRV